MQPLGQGDDRSEGVAHGVVEFGGHSGLVPRGIALHHELLLGRVGGELGVPVLQGLPMRAGDRCHGEHGDEESALPHEVRQRHPLLHEPRQWPVERCEIGDEHEDQSGGNAQEPLADARDGDQGVDRDQQREEELSGVTLDHLDHEGHVVDDDDPQRPAPSPDQG